MKVLNTQNIASIVISLLMTMLFYSCKPKAKQTIALDFKEVAQGIGREVVIKHTDSGRLTAVLNAKILKDYTHTPFPYYEFPEGVLLTIFDKKGQKSTVKSDYAIQYDATKLVNLQGNVKIITADSMVLKAPQLYWNQNLHWVHTDNPYEVTFKNGAYNKGIGFDANENFTMIKSRSNIGTQLLKE